MAMQLKADTNGITISEEILKNARETEIYHALCAPQIAKCNNAMEKLSTDIKSNFISKLEFTRTINKGLWIIVSAILLNVLASLWQTTSVNLIRSKGDDVTQIRKDLREFLDAQKKTSMIYADTTKMYAGK